jgi:outer membrane protein assembly factor BamB
MRPAWTASLLILFACGPVVASTPAKSGPQFRFDAKGRVVRLDRGKVAWATKLDRPLDLHGEWALDWDEWRVYVADRGGLSALAVSTGKPLWHSEGATKVLLVRGRLVITLGEERGVWRFTGRGAASGVLVFQVKLPAGRFGGASTWSVREVAGMYLVQIGSLHDDQAVLIDRHGSVRHHFEHLVVEALTVGKEGVFLSGGEVVVASAGREGRWVTPFANPEPLPGGELVGVGGDWIASLYCRNADSGVQLVRFNAATGKVVWRARCEPLGVDHSKYRHNATVAIEGERLRVTSKGSFGTFVELLDLKTGKRLGRTVPKK